MLTLAQSLMVAVLEQAIADLRSPNPGVRWQARAWFLARDSSDDHPFCFLRICEEFRHTPAMLRARILARFAAELDPAHESGQSPHTWATKSGVRCIRRSAVASSRDKAEASS